MNVTQEHKSMLFQFVSKMELHTNSYINNEMQLHLILLITQNRLLSCQNFVCNNKYHSHHK